MARKKADGTMTKADAVRSAIAAGVDKPADGAAYVREKFGLDVSPQQFSTYKSIANKKAGKAPGRRGRKAAPPAAPTNGRRGSNPADLARQVKALIGQFGAVAVSDMVAVFAD
jgi:hypothetical protein